MILNLTDLANFGGFETDICKTAEFQYSLDCLNKWFCPQISNYLVNTSIVIIVAVLVGSWAFWWILTHGYKQINYDVPKWQPNGWAYQIFGDLRKFETRIYWADFFKDKMLKLCIGFLAVLVFLYKKW